MFVHPGLRPGCACLGWPQCRVVLHGCAVIGSALPPVLSVCPPSLCCSDGCSDGRCPARLCCSNGCSDGCSPARLGCSDGCSPASLGCSDGQSPPSLCGSKLKASCCDGFLSRGRAGFGAVRRCVIRIVRVLLHTVKANDVSKGKACLKEHSFVWVSPDDGGARANASACLTWGLNCVRGQLAPFTTRTLCALCEQFLMPERTRWVRGRE